jgi:hypothetical protein
MRIFLMQCGFPPTGTERLENALKNSSLVAKYSYYCHPVKAAQWKHFLLTLPPTRQQVLQRGFFLNNA